MTTRSDAIPGWKIALGKLRACRYLPGALDEHVDLVPEAKGHENELEAVVDQWFRRLC